MSKLVRLLDSLGESGGAKLGFGAKDSKSKTPQILVVVRADSPVKKESADLAILKSPPKDPSAPPLWGLTNAPRPPKGCGFVLVESPSAPASLLNNVEEVAVGYKLPANRDRELRAALEYLEFAFIVAEKPDLNFPLTFEQLIAIQSLAADFDHHIFLEIRKSPQTLEDLEVLRDVPVAGLVVDNTRMNARETARLRELIAELKPRRQPLAGAPLVKPSEAGDF